MFQTITNVIKKQTGYNMDGVYEILKVATGKKKYINLKRKISIISSKSLKIFNKKKLPRLGLIFIPQSNSNKLWV